MDEPEVYFDVDNPSVYHTARKPMPLHYALRLHWHTGGRVNIILGAISLTSTWVSAFLVSSSCAHQIVRILGMG